MNTPNRPLHRRAVLFLLGGALASIIPTIALSAEAAAMQPLADKAAPLPLKVTFRQSHKGEDAGLFTLRLKNTSEQSVTASASIVVSVPVHNSPKIREEPAQEIKPGKTWSIKQLASGDKITVKADGFEPLEVTVPEKK